MDRRNVIKTGVAGALSLWAAPLLGAGIAGLTTAYLLGRAGRKVVVGRTLCAADDSTRAPCTHGA